MFSERNFDNHIIRDLVNYFFDWGVHELEVKASIYDHKAVITVTGDIELDDVEFQHLQRSLNNGRKAELEGYYAQMLGIDQTDPDLNMLGLLIDHADVEQKNGRVSITTYREL